VLDELAPPVNTWAAGRGCRAFGFAPGRLQRREVTACYDCLSAPRFSASSSRWWTGSSRAGPSWSSAPSRRWSRRRSSTCW